MRVRSERVDSWRSRLSRSTAPPRAAAPLCRRPPPAAILWSLLAPGAPLRIVNINTTLWYIPLLHAQINTYLQFKKNTFFLAPLPHNPIAWNDRDTISIANNLRFGTQRAINTEWTLLVSIVTGRVNRACGSVIGKYIINPMVHYIRCEAVTLTHGHCTM